MPDDSTTILVQIQEGLKELQAGQHELRDNQQEFQAGQKKLEDNQQELQRSLDTTREDLRSEFNEKFEELHRHFDVVAEDLRSDIRLVAEGVVQNRETIEAFKEENAREHEELRSVIRLSYSDLDRRLESQEDRTDSLGGRVDRLEAQAP